MTAQAWVGEGQVNAELQIGWAEERDLPRILELSNWAAAHTTANFATRPESLEEWRETWGRTRHRFPWLVARSAIGLVGFAKAAPYRNREAYAWSAAVSVYVAPEQHGRGVGTALYRVLVPLLRAQGYVTLLAGVTDGNEASERLHARLGFVRCGTFHQVGWKFERWHDVGYWELHLGGPDEPPRPIRPVTELVAAHEDHEAPQYFGTRRSLGPGALLGAGNGELAFTMDLDGAIWSAELEEGEGAPRVYRVRALGPHQDAALRAGWAAPPHPAMSLRTLAPLQVLEEVTQWTYYHGTKAELRVGDLIEPGHVSNYGAAPRRANFVYFARTLDASIWGAELASGDGPPRIYRVEPTGAIEDDPNLTNMRFRGNPTKSFRSRSALRVVAELAEWKGHPPEVVTRMKEGLAKLNAAGVAADD